MVTRVTGRFAYKSFRLQVDSPTSRSFRLHDQSRFAYTVWVDSPTLNTLVLLNTKYLSKNWQISYNNYSNCFSEEYSTATSRYAERSVSTNESS